MKKSYTVKILFIAIIVAVSFFSCREASHHTSHINSDTSDRSTAVNASIVANVPAITAEKGARIHSVQLNGVVSYDSRNKISISSRVTGRIERLSIKYNFQPVKKGQLIMEIYSPDLAAAQRELLFVARTNAGELL